jgi:hypothetical protein
MKIDRFARAALSRERARADYFPTPDALAAFL